MESAPCPDDAMFTQTVRALMNRLVSTPAIVVNQVGDVLSTNVLGEELFSEFSIRSNLVRMIFLDAAARCCVDAWHGHARDAVARLRAGYLRSPADSAISGLVSELLSSSALFQTMWMQRDGIPRHRTTRVFPHREMGPLVVHEVVLSSAAEPGRTVLVYVPAPGSASHDALRILGALHATTAVSASPRR